MFGKKILSVVGLLYLVSKFDSASAACEFTYDSTSPTVCNVSGGCTENNYYLVYKENDDDSTTYSSGTIKEFGTKLIKITSIDFSGGYTSECREITEDVGYFKSGSSFIYKDHSDAFSSTPLTLKTSDEECVEGYLTDNGKLCIDDTYDNAVTLENGKSYIVKNVYSVFSSTATDIVAIKSENNALLLDATTFNNDDFCVDSNTRVITKKRDNYCGDDGCDKYYHCTNGICQDKTNTDYVVRTPEGCNIFTGAGCSSDDEGVYYFIGSDDESEASNLSGSLQTVVGENGYLYKCSINDTGNNTGCEVDKISAGYFVNANTEDNIAYIRCSVNGTTTTCIGLQDAPETVNNCSGGAGGIILVEDNYKTCTDTDDEHATPLIAKSITIQRANSCSTASAGELIKDGNTYKLCVEKNGNGLKPVAFTAASYFVDAGVTGAFNDVATANYFVAVTIDTKSAVVSKSANPKKYRYAVAATLEIVEKADASSKGMCSTRSLDTDVGHEFAMTAPTSGTDNVHYYKDITAA